MNEQFQSLWDELAGDSKPLLLYGTGNGADKILDVLEARGISVTGVFASDGFVRDRFFRGMKVHSYAEVRGEYGDAITVLPAFGTDRPEIIRFLHEMDARHDLRIPEVPLYGGALFDGGYFREHRDELSKARVLFADERSRQLFDDAVSFRLTGRLRFLADTETMRASLCDLFHGHRIQTAADGGAYRGDSTEDLLCALNPAKVYALEADPKTFQKLTAYAESRDPARILPIHAALWDSETELPYSASDSRGAGRSGQNRRSSSVTVPARTLDSLFRDTTLDLVKLDIEGAEWEALRGGRALLARCEPNLAVSLYHRTDDLWALPAAIHGLLPAHRLYLRRVPCVPLWDLTLYAVRAEKE